MQAVFLYTADSKYSQDKDPPFGRIDAYDMMMLVKHLNKQSPTLLYRPVAVQGSIHFIAFDFYSQLHCNHIQGIYPDTPRIHRKFP